jgi:hypothetical protein
MLKTGVVIKCVVLHSNLGLLLVGNTKKSGLSIATPHLIGSSGEICR